MEFLKKHTALIILGAIIAGGFYNLGWQKGQSQVSQSVEIDSGTEIEPVSVDFAPYWKAWNILNEKYVAASSTAESISEQEKVWGSIQGLAASLGDPYTVFFPPVQAELFESEVRGNFEGVGMEILAQEGAITVVAPLKSSPAERAGLLPGDRILEINDESTLDITTEEAVQLIRGERGTTVNLTIFRPSSDKDPFRVSVVRDVINIPTLETRITPEGIFVIELYNFSAQAPNLFRQALREFILSGSNKLILDLRGNPGGYLEASIDMASWFLPSSAVVVREDFGNNEDEKIYRSKGYNIFNENLELVILVNSGSASASEIMAGALMEHGQATLVGEKTFGKGSVQELINITRDTSLKVTIARWLTPNGVSISDGGITPDYVVERTSQDKEAGRDPQFRKAVELLTN